MFPNCHPIFYPFSSDIDLMKCVAFDSLNHILAEIGLFRCKGDTSTRNIDNCGDVGLEAGVAATGERTAVLMPLEHIV